VCKQIVRVIEQPKLTPPAFCTLGKHKTKNQRELHHLLGAPFNARESETTCEFLQKTNPEKRDRKSLFHHLGIIPSHPIIWTNTHSQFTNRKKQKSAECGVLHMKELAYERIEMPYTAEQVSLTEINQEKRSITIAYILNPTPHLGFHS
jgi:hypothetical protein